MTLADLIALRDNPRTTPESRRRASEALSMLACGGEPAKAKDPQAMQAQNHSAGGAGDAAPKPPAPAMNNWESEYAARLEIRRIAGEVAWFQFEAVRLKIGKNAWYKPDFAVLLPSGKFYVVEVKGFWREAAKVRIKVAAERYPFDFVVARKVDGQWVEEKV